MLFVANFLKNLPKKVQVEILKNAVKEQTNITINELVKYFSLSTNLETNVIPAITPFGLTNWNIKVSIKVTGLMLSDLDEIFENEIL